MYLDKSKITIKGKTYSRYLLRESYREGNKVKHRTIANLTKSRPEEIRAIEIALRHKHELTKLSDALKAVEYKQGQPVRGNGSKSGMAGTWFRGGQWQRS